MFSLLAGLNLTLRFVVELAAFAAAGLWGAQEGGVALAVLLPVAAATLWGLLAAPKATAPDGIRRTTQVLVLGGAALALAAAGMPAAGAVFAAAAAVNATLMALLPEPSWA
jgi:hypothetical protein